MQWSSLILGHFEQWTCTTVFQSNSRNERRCEKPNFSSHPTWLESCLLINQCFAKLRSILWLKNKKQLSVNILDDFIAMQYSKRIYGKAHSLGFLWNETYGPKIVQETFFLYKMFKTCYPILFIFYPLDNKTIHRWWSGADKVMHIRE